MILFILSISHNINISIDEFLINELKCFPSAALKTFFWYYFQSVCSAVQLILSQPTITTFVSINQMKPPTPITNPTSRCCWSLYPLKLPKTTASTTKALILASTPSSSAEVMFLIVYKRRKENFANTERKWERKDMKFSDWLKLINLYMKQGLYTAFPIFGPKPT